MADTSLTPTPASKIDADPAGDLVLVISSGDNQRSIRASSKALSLASPVLTAMFSPRRFAEGTALSTSNPPEIHLPEDDPEAVTMFCHLVHFREYHGKQPGLSFDQLMNMALFCDKYDAGLALNPWSEVWLRPQSGFEKSGDYRNLLALAYAFDNQEGFWISSRSMMQYDIVDRVGGTRAELLPGLCQISNAQLLFGQGWLRLSRIIPAQHLANFNSDQYSQLGLYPENHHRFQRAGEYLIQTRFINYDNKGSRRAERSLSIVCEEGENQLAPRQLSCPPSIPLYWLAAI